jgi:hypoxanthine phosphoribosyltransferase
MEQDLARILITAPAIAARNRQLAAQLSADYAGQPFTVIVISCGALIFAADLVRLIPLPLELGVISAKSYAGTRSTGQVALCSQLQFSLADRQVLVVDDIYDSGLTLATIVAHLRQQQPRAIRTCVLLCKERPRETTALPDYVGFTIADEFVVGYGLDFRERYRNLPYLGVLHAQLYA